MAKLGTLYSQDMKGFSSFEADSIPDFDEFDTESVTLSYFKERCRLDYRTARECGLLHRGSPNNTITP